jgi:predicted metal-dependent hydrolase
VSSVASRSSDSESDLERFAECWNAERFFDAHETLEPRWIATRDRGLRGLIQLAAAFVHLSKNNKKGARITFERAIVRLRDPENAPCAVDQSALADFAAGVLAKLDGADPTDIIASRPRLSIEKKRE